MSALAPELDFEAHDGFLFAVLGLIHASRTLGEALPEAPREDAPPNGGVAAPDGASRLNGGVAAPESACSNRHVRDDGRDDPILDALLGLVALRASADRLVATLAPEAPARQAPSSEAPKDEPLRPTGVILR